MELTTGEKIARLIGKGQADAELDRILDAAVHRRRYLRALEAYEQVQQVKVGDRVEIKDEVRPKYLARQRGTVVGISRRTSAGVPLVEVKFDRGPIGKFRSGIILLHGSSFRVLPQLHALTISGDDVEETGTEGNVIVHG